MDEFLSGDIEIYQVDSVQTLDSAVWMNFYPAI